MPDDLLNFKCAVITGGGGGIGRALAEWLLKEGKKVIIVGRTESKLATASGEMKQSSHSDVPYYVLDTGKVADITGFVERVIQDHPDVDCLINNAGIQRPFNVLQDFDLTKADQEIDINIRGPLHLALRLLPHLLKNPSGAVIVNVGSVLGYNPFSIINPVYNGTKAWVHFWSMNLRTQLAGTKVRVVEIVPPTVATDLHRERSDPDDNKKEKNPDALTVDEFMSDVAAQWKDGKTTIGAGMSKQIVGQWFGEFGDTYDKAADKFIDSQ